MHGLPSKNGPADPKCREGCGCLFVSPKHMLRMKHAIIFAGNSPCTAHFPEDIQEKLLLLILCCGPSSGIEEVFSGDHMNTD